MFDRLFHISKAYINHHLRQRRTGTTANDDSFGTASEQRQYHDGTSRASDTNSASGATANPFGLPQQVLDDLSLFEIAPPGSWNEVIQARNREMKRYHPDKYMSKETKVDAANEIAQIYNAAFERLKAHFKP